MMKRKGVIPIQADADNQSVHFVKQGENRILTIRLDVITLFILFGVLSK